MVDRARHPLDESLGLAVALIDRADVDAHFGFVGSFSARSMTGSSQVTRDLHDWEPTGPSLVEDVLTGASTA